MSNINDNFEHSASQARLIYEYMAEGHSITPIEALNKFNCFRLGARIGDLKKRGYNIRTRKVKDAKTGKYFASYSLSELPTFTTDSTIEI